MADVQTALTTLFGSIVTGLTSVVTNNLPVIGGAIAIFIVVGVGLKFGLKLLRKA
jgi:lysozyme family protein